MDDFEQRLKKSGLTGNEAKVYLELIRKGELSANDLAKKIGMDRTLTYTVLNHLIEKGFVSHIVKESKKFFKAADPANLLNPIKEKESYVNDLILQLRKIEQVKEVASEVTVYEGKAGLRALMREIMANKSFCSFGATGRAYDALYEMPRLAKELATKGYHARIIAASGFKKHEMTQLKNIEVRFLDIKTEATTSIFGDKIAIHLIKDKPLVIIIKNKDVADSYMKYFEHLWKTARK